MTSVAEGAGGPRWWVRFRAWPRWAQTLGWALLTAIPIMVLVVVDRPRLWVLTGLLVAVLGLLYAIVVVLPARLVSAEGLTREQVLKARNDVRSGLLTALTLAGALLGAYLGLRQLELGREELRQNLEASRRTLELTREGQITERFTRAIDQLGSEQLDIRLGGIYALERIARDSKADNGPIMEIFTAFLREHAYPGSPVLSAAEPAPGTIKTAMESEAGTEPPRLRADLQATLTVIGRRTVDGKSDARLDLSGVYVPGADLLHANLAGVDLHKANLEEGKLGGANLAGAFLGDANLTAADVAGANLVRAFLIRANLAGAGLSSANLAGASLSGANLAGAAFLDANLTKADVRRANLGGAALGAANLEDASLTGANLSGAFVRDANLAGADLRDANLAGADLKGARADSRTRWPAGFDPTAAGVVIER